MSERHTTSSEAEQQLIFDLMRERLLDMFGAGGNFRISLGSATADDAVFVSELSFALYLFPLMFGGVGVNLISHILVSHLVGAERRFSKAHAEERQP